jgi:hypothetical protein
LTPGDPTVINPINVLTTEMFEWKSNDQGRLN